MRENKNAEATNYYLAIMSVEICKTPIRSMMKV